jgi:hypothetical protein
VLENQHKFSNILQQCVRLCSSKPAAQPLPNAETEKVQLKQMSPISPGMAEMFQKIEHEPDVGNLFRVRIKNHLKIDFQ